VVHAPIGRVFSVRMGAIKGPSVKAWWYDARTGHATPVGELPRAVRAGLFARDGRLGARVQRRIEG
jgi:hypothetical protein